VIALAAVGLAGWIGVRVKSALRTRAALGADRARTAAAAAADTGPGASLVRGTPATWRPRVSLDGTLAPWQQTDLGFKAPGRLASIRVHVGDRVKKGEVLATLDATEALASVQAAEAQVKVAEAQLALASDAAERTSQLIGGGAAAAQSGVQVREQRALASAQRDAARAQLALAAATLSNHTLVAPFSGFVTRVPAGAGAIVAPGVGLFRLEDTTRLKLVATVGDEEAAMVKPGVAVEVRVGGRRYGARVLSVLPSVDASTRRVPVEAEVDNDGALRAGLFVRAEAVGERELPVLRLPANVLRPGSQDEVMVVKDRRLAPRQVRFATEADGSLLVRSGLAAAEVVLVSPSAEAHEGDPCDATLPPPLKN
jgi:RND family efflux transporter MFP subunit